MFSDQNGIRIEINNRKMTEKCSNIWKLNNILPNNPWVKEVVSRKICLNVYSKRK